MMKPSYDHSSAFRILKGGKISLVVSTFIVGSAVSFASPGGGVVTAGSAVIDLIGSVTNITQSTQRASVNWQNFSIAPNETVNFIQPDASSVTLNRVIGNETSLIEGALNANGQVWILNSNGLLFGQGASVNTAGLVASTMNISDADFMAGNSTFHSTGSTESVINMGTISSTAGGYVAFLGKDVHNEGLIHTTKGTTALAAGDNLTLNFNGNSLIGISINQGTLDALIENRGAIIAEGGSIYLTTQAAESLINGVVNNTGLLEAQTLDDVTGYIEVYAHGGTAVIGGTLHASGGFIETSGEELNVIQGTSINAAHWLIDPVNVTIDAALASTLEGQLATGDATVTTAAAGSDAGDINVNTAINWNANTLNLIADQDIHINALMNATGSAGLDMTGNVKIGFNSGDATGFSGKIDMAGTTSLTINGNPYTIINTLGAQGSTTGTDLQGINGALGGFYALGSNIDASGTVSWDGSAGFMPIGDYPLSFTGSFDGLGHTLSGLNIDRSGRDFVGLFGYTNGADLRNTAITGVNISGGSYTGALVGYNVSGSVRNAFMTGNIIGMDSVGGLVGGSNTGTVSDSYAAGTVVGDNLVGGLIGESFGDITHSYSISDVTGSGIGYMVGGLTGYIDASTISGSFATGTVNGGRYVGGLVGALDGGTVNGSYSTANVNGTQYMIGGLVGAQGGTITDAYATGTVQGDDQVGGLVGYAENSTIADSYAVGAVSGNTNLGGLVGNTLNTTVTASFWDTSTTGQATSSGGTGLSTSNMKNTKTFYDAGWNFDTVWGRDTANIVNGGYLALKPLHPDFTFKTVLAMSVDPTKIYDGSTTITPVLNRAEFVDTVSVIGAVNVGTYASSSLSDYGFTFNDGKTINDFEILLYSSGTMSITPKDLTVSGITANDKFYDSTTDATVSTSSVLLAGLVSGDNITLASTGQFSDVNIGNGKTVHLTNTYGGTDLSNYTIADQLTATANILATTINEVQENTLIDESTNTEIEQIVATINNESALIVETTDTVIASNTAVLESLNTADSIINLLDEGVNLPEGVEEEDK